MSDRGLETQIRSPGVLKCFTSEAVTKKVVNQSVMGRWGLKSRDNCYSFQIISDGTF